MALNPKGVNMVWFEKEVVNQAKIILKKASYKIAKSVRDDAKAILKQKAENTTERGLLAQFDIVPDKSDETTYLVWCQGPRKWWKPYHASFLELGWIPRGATSKTRKQTAKPFLRPAGKKNKRNAQRKFQKALDKL